MNDKQLALYTFYSFFNNSDSESDSDSDSDTSNSGSSDDELFEDEVETMYTILMMVDKSCANPVHKPAPNNHIERVIPSYMVEEFKSSFRMLPSTYEHVLALIGPAITSSSAFVGRKTIEADKQLKLTLYYLASPNSYRSMCEMFGVGRATIVRTLKRVTYALHCLAPQWIKWPKGDEAVRVSQEFEAVCGFPRVIGAIAGTQVNVPAPREDACSIVNRKNDYSIHLQVVCDARGVFTHCVAGDTASFLESSARGASPLAGRLADPQEHFPGGAHLVGDAAYGIQTHLQVPFGAGATELQRNYDWRLALGARAAEQALGRLRGRFRGLQDTLPVADTKKIPELVMACCVLHNVCALGGDRLDDEDYAAPTLTHVPVHADAGARAMGEQLREAIMKRLPLKTEQMAT